MEDILALDIALRRNDSDWFERLPPNIEQDVIHKLYYGHFFCHVLHQDYIVRKGVDPIALEHRMLHLVEQQRAWRNALSLRSFAVPFLQRRRPRSGETGSAPTLIKAS